MTAINLNNLTSATTLDDLANRMRGHSWFISTNPIEGTELCKVHVMFEQRNKVRGKVTRRQFGTLEFEKPKSFAP